jgi:hypothetical protein
MDVIDLTLGLIIPYARNPRRVETAIIASIVMRHGVTRSAGRPSEKDVGRHANRSRALPGSI